MTSGRGADRRVPGLNPNIEIKRFRDYVLKVEAFAASWPAEWSWILEEYEILREKLKQITEKSVMVHDESVPDPRTVSPLPNSTNHTYGWICSKPEFRLEIYGPDVNNNKIPDIYSDP